MSGWKEYESWRGDKSFCRDKRGEDPREEKPRRAAAFIGINTLYESTNSSAAQSLEDSRFLVHRLFKGRKLLR